MSEEQLKAFLEAVKADAGLQAQLKAAKDPDALVAIAKTAGFVISDLTRARAEMEISEEELEEMQGGARMLNYKTSYLYCGTMYCCYPTKLPQGCD